MSPVGGGLIVTLAGPWDADDEDDVDVEAGTLVPAKKATAKSATAPIAAPITVAQPASNFHLPRPFGPLCPEVDVCVVICAPYQLGRKRTANFRQMEVSSL